MVAAPSARVYLRRPFAALRKAGRQSSKVGAMVAVSAEVSHDLIAIRDRFRKRQGALFAAASIVSEHGSNSGATDASRTVGGYSGMGGICFKSKRFWWYKLSERHSKIPIHVTEFVAELVHMALCQDSWDDGYTELVDNMAVVQSIRQGKPKDWRLLELLLLRHHLNEAGGIQATPEYIKSKDNVFADALSRGEFQKFRSALRVEGLEGFTGLDLNTIRTDSHIGDLLERMMDVHGIS